MTIGRAALIVSAVLAGTGIAAAERMARINRDTFACVTWAAWHDYSQASLTARGARASRLCPRRLPKSAAVTVIDEDAGEGASEVRYEGRSWFVDAQRLE